MFQTIRRIIRARSRRIPVERAEVMKKRFSLLYFLCAWNLLAYIGYLYYDKHVAPDHKNFPEETLGEAMMRRGQIQNAKVYRFHNFTRVDDIRQSPSDQSTEDV